MIDINVVRDPEILMHGLTKVDEPYTFYYDETNNIRRLHIKSNGLNEPEPQCFVLGGIVHNGPVRNLNIETLRTDLMIQKSAKEIKLKLLGKGGFLDLLGSAKVETFLKWLLENDLLIHYQVLDVMYWSTVDIVDTIIAEIGRPELIMLSMEIKNDLYAILRHDLDGTVDLLKRYSYPDVGKERRVAFIDELNNLSEERRSILPRFNFQMLKGVLEMAAKLESLPYLEGEEPNILISEFSMFYQNRICLFKNSSHILDIEEVIRKRIEAQPFSDNGHPFKNHRFVDSKTEAGVQIADLAVGLLGNAFTFINRTAMSDLRDVRDAFTPMQARNLSLLASLTKCSIHENPAFAHYILSLEDRRRAAFLFED